MIHDAMYASLACAAGRLISSPIVSCPSQSSPYSGFAGRVAKMSYANSMEQSSTALGRIRRREALRITTARLPIELWLSRVGLCKAEAAALLDISVIGAQVSYDKPITLHQSIQCRFALEGAGFFSVCAIPLRVDHVAGEYIVGVQFTLGLEAESRLTRWIFRHQAALVRVPAQR